MGMTANCTPNSAPHVAVLRKAVEGWKWGAGLLTLSEF